MGQDTSHLEFAPPEERGGGRSLALALFVHALLLMALTWGIHWRVDPQDNTVDAELWSVVPEPVALKADPLTPAKTQPEPPAKVTPEKKPLPAPVKPIDPPKENLDLARKKAADADIAIEKQKKKEEAEKLALEKQAEKRRKAQELEAEKERKAALLREEAAKRKEEENRRREEENRRKEEEARRLEQEAKDAEERTQLHIKRLKSLGQTATGPVDSVNDSKGTGGKPSDSYLARLSARVKPNITFSETQLETVKGNPAAEVEVICSPSGQITGMKLTQSSGNAAWDQAVLKAIEKTATLPRDENGKIPSKIPFVFRPRD